MLNRRLNLALAFSSALLLAGCASSPEYTDFVEIGNNTYTISASSESTDNGGSVEKVDKWGAKKLAYPINFKEDGYYVLMNFECEPALVAEMERQLRINDQVMRHMVVKKEGAAYEQGDFGGEADRRP